MKSFGNKCRNSAFKKALNFFLSKLCHFGELNLFSNLNYVMLGNKNYKLATEQKLKHFRAAKVVNKKRKELNCANLIPTTWNVPVRWIFLEN